MSSTRVVLADDHAVIRASIRKFLDYAPDIEVVGEAINGVEAMHLVEELAPDVLLLDIEMPHMTGLEVARRLQTTNSPPSILALSAHDDRSYIQGILDLGAAGYLIKSEAAEVVVEAVRDVAGGEQDWLSRLAAKRLSL